MNRRLYALHRWVSLAGLVQLWVWSVSGLYFNLSRESAVKGNPVADAHVAALGEKVPSIAAIREPSKLVLGGEPERIDIIGTPAGTFVVARRGDLSVRFDERGALSPPTADEAGVIARRDQPGSPVVRAVRWLDRGDAPVEYRGRPLPAFQVELDDDESTHVYVDAQTGEVTARRTGTWRVYDFLWGLHIMDYGDREDIRGMLLLAFGSIALLTATTGAVLWIARLARRKRS